MVTNPHAADGAGKETAAAVDGVRVSITSQCVGTTMCTTVAPALFEMTGGRSRPRRAVVSRSDELWDAVESCPVQAIEVVDTATDSSVGP